MGLAEGGAKVLSCLNLTHTEVHTQVSFLVLDTQLSLPALRERKTDRGRDGG